MVKLFCISKIENLIQGLKVDSKQPVDEKGRLFFIPDKPDNVFNPDNSVTISPLADNSKKSNSFSYVATMPYAIINSSAFFEVITLVSKQV